MEFLVDTPLMISAVVSEEEPPPGAKRAREHPPAYAPCARCGLLVLTGRTETDDEVTLDPHLRTYVVLWHNNVPQPELRVSAGYPVHLCRPEEPA